MKHISYSLNYKIYYSTHNAAVFLSCDFNLPIRTPSAYEIISKKMAE